MNTQPTIMHFEHYLSANKQCNLHPKLNKVWNAFPQRLHDLKNVLLLGPSGVGKYTQMLKMVKRYSPSGLKYEKKMRVVFNKQTFVFKISDVHFEIDMSLLGCNSKLLWHEIYLQIMDILSARTEKQGIVVCKNFHEIQTELLETWYSYMQEPLLMGNNQAQLKFCLLTEQMSFIPDNILQCCQIIRIPRPTRTQYNKIIPAFSETPYFPLECIHNIKSFLSQTREIETNITEALPIPLQNHQVLCDKIVNQILNPGQITFSKCRDLLYDLLIYHLNIYQCVEYILSAILHKIPLEKRSEVIIKTFYFFKFFNNNYRPIYHLEQYFYMLVMAIGHKDI
jgi:hypothetical protein